MAATFDGETLLITLAGDASGVVNLDWRDVYSDWKNWMLANPLNRRYPEAFRTTGGDPLNALLNQGAYWFLRNDYGWRIKPAEQNVTYYVSGNLAPQDAALPSFSPTTGNYSTQVLGLQPITQGFSLQLAAGLTYGLYNDGVTIDIISGTAGTGNDSTGDPIGTEKTPSDNITDAKTIALREGFQKFYVKGNLTITTGTDVSNFQVIGQSKTKSTITIEASSTSDGLEVYEAAVTGTLDGDVRLQYCLLETLNYVNGFIIQCGLSNNTITLGGSEDSHFVNCWSEVAGLGTPVINMGGTGRDLSLRGYIGGIKITNLTGDDRASLDFVSGQAIIDSTCTAGTIVVRGADEVQDNSGPGCTVVIQSQNDEIAEAVMEAEVESGVTVEEALKVIAAALGGKVSGAGTTNIKFRNLGDTKDVIDATVDENGNRSSVTLDTT